MRGTARDIRQSSGQCVGDDDIAGNAGASVGDEQRIHSTLTKFDAGGGHGFLDLEVNHRLQAHLCAGSEVSAVPIDARRVDDRAAGAVFNRRLERDGFAAPRLEIKRLVNVRAAQTRWQRVRQTHTFGEAAARVGDSDREHGLVTGLHEVAVNGFRQCELRGRRDHGW